MNGMDNDLAPGLMRSSSSAFASKSNSTQQRPQAAHKFQFYAIDLQARIEKVNEKFQGLKDV